MRETMVRASAALLGVLVLGGAEIPAQYSRRTPLVEVIEKTEQGIVSLEVSKSSGFGKKDVVGTGVIVDERGYLITNAHVTADGSRFKVKLHDGTITSAELVLEDNRMDLAILRVSTRTPMKALPLAPGSDLKRGETVIAVGNPFGFTNTVSTGIISGLKREITMPTGYVLTNLTQHTAVLNPGNSGGPLLNVNGELIGINVALRDGAQGIGFALNSDDVQRWLSKHLSASKISRIGHGVRCREQVVKREGHNRQKVVVSTVEDHSPAARAGLKEGDVIVAIGGRAVQNRFDVERALWSVKPGQQVEASVVRDGRPACLSLNFRHVLAPVSRR